MSHIHRNMGWQAPRATNVRLSLRLCVGSGGIRADDGASAPPDEVWRPRRWRLGEWGWVRTPCKLSGEPLDSTALGRRRPLLFVVQAPCVLPAFFQVLSLRQYIARRSPGRARPHSERPPSARRALHSHAACSKAWRADGDSCCLGLRSMHKTVHLAAS